jgi:hypothetical protein
LEQKALAALYVMYAPSGEWEVRLTGYGYQSFVLWEQQPGQTGWTKVREGQVVEGRLSTALPASVSPASTVLKLALLDRHGRVEELGLFKDKPRPASPFVADQRQARRGLKFRMPFAFLVNGLGWTSHEG